MLQLEDRRIDSFDKSYEQHNLNPQNPEPWIQDMMGLPSLMLSSMVLMVALCTGLSAIVTSANMSTEENTVDQNMIIMYIMQ